MENSTNYFGVMEASIALKLQEVSNQEFDTWFTDETMDATISLRTSDGKEYQVEVMDLSINWEDTEE